MRLSRHDLRRRGRLHRQSGRRAGRPRRQELFRWSSGSRWCGSGRAIRRAPIRRRSSSTRGTTRQANGRSATSGFDLDCNFMLVMDALMDQTHLGYVHAKTIGGTPEFHNAAGQITTPHGERRQGSSGNVLDHPAAADLHQGHGVQAAISTGSRNSTMSRRRRSASSRPPWTSAAAPSTTRTNRGPSASACSITRRRKRIRVATISGRSRERLSPARSAGGAGSCTTKSTRPFLEDKVVLEAQQRSIPARTGPSAAPARPRHRRFRRAPGAGGLRPAGEAGERPAPAVAVEVAAADLPAETGVTLRPGAPPRNRTAEPAFMRA